MSTDSRFAMEAAIPMVVSEVAGWDGRAQTFAIGEFRILPPQ
jgi:hypothetical protein